MFFTYRARNGNWLLGGLLSSRDASQRRYPFFIFQLLKGDDSTGLVNPFTLGELFSAQIKPMLHQAVQGADCTRLFERIKALRPLQGQDLTCSAGCTPSSCMISASRMWPVPFMDPGQVSTVPLPSPTSSSAVPRCRATLQAASNCRCRPNVALKTPLPTCG